jgi:hypothetical protein
MGASPTVTPLYVRPSEAIKIVPVSRRTLGNWTRKKIIAHYRVNRCLMFRVADLETGLEKYRVAAIGEPKPRKITTSPTTTTTTEPPARKRRAMRIQPA